MYYLMIFMLYKLFIFYKLPYILFSYFGPYTGRAQIENQANGSRVTSNFTEPRFFRVLFFNERIVQNTKKQRSFEHYYCTIHDTQ